MTQLREMPTDHRAVYFCPGCSAAYSTEKQARDCANANGAPTKFKPGDIVIGGTEYGWHDGKEHWVTYKESEWNGTPFRAHIFFWVVTSTPTRLQVDGNFGRLFSAQPKDLHDSILCLHTLGIDNGWQGGMRGWSREDYFELARNVPEQVKREARKLIGPVHNTLL